jgi:glycosyltransferase involved in cell wall biosynthesis
LVVEPNDEIDLADSMVELANNRTLYKKLQSEENEIGKKFTWEIAAKKHIEVFREIIDST